MKHLLFVFGTRPEAVKLAPLILHCRQRTGEFRVRVCVTAQHRRLLDQILALFEIQPDADLNVMRHDQSLSGLAARVLDGLDQELAAHRPDFVVVQGDTTTTLAGALAAFHRRVPCGHVEAGLRTGDLSQPFPEEANRVLTTRLASLHFAPTEDAARNLAAEGVAADSVFVTGNTGIDALLFTRDRLERGEWRGFDGLELNPAKKLILLTAHRRESFGDGFESICRAVLRIAARGDVEIVYPVHPNPNVRGTVERHLAGQAAIHLIEPLDYVPFVDLMRRADILLTDSGGVQEEGPSFHKPVLVLRDRTERPEAVAAGAARLTGTDENCIVAEVSRLLDGGSGKSPMTRVENPFGDGAASPRVAAAILSFLK